MHYTQSSSFGKWEPLAAGLVVALALAACGSLPEVSGSGRQVTAPATTFSVDRIVVAPRTALPVSEPPAPKRPIYIVNPNAQGTLSGIMVVDPDTQQTVSSIPTRFLPEAVLSPDGSRLYVADSYRAGVTRGQQRDVVSVYDTRTGEVLVDDQPVQGRLLYKAIPVGPSFMFLSDDGRTLYIGKYGDPDPHQTRLAVLDAETLATLHEGPYPPCGRLVVARSDSWLCTQPDGMGSGFALLVVDPVRGTVTETLLELPGLHLAGLALARNGQRLFVLDGVNQLTILSLPDRNPLSKLALDVPVGWTLAREVMVSPDGGRLYAGFDTGRDPSAVFSEVLAVFDTATGTRVSTIQLADSITDVALSMDGEQVYAVSPFARSLAVYEAATGRELGVMRDIDGTPARILIAPSVR